MDEVDNSNVEIKLSYSYALFLLIPIHTLIAGGIVYRRRQNEEISLYSFLTGSIGIAVNYSIVLSVFHFLVDLIIRFISSNYGESANVDNGTAYFFIEVFIKALTFGIIFSFMGMMFCIDFHKVTNHIECLISFENSVNQGLSAFIRGILSVIMVIIMLTKVNVLNNGVEDLGLSLFPSLIEKTTMIAVLAGFQISGLIFSMLHIVPIAFTLETLDENVGLDYSFKTSAGVISTGDLGVNFFFSYHNMTFTYS